MEPIHKKALSLLKKFLIFGGIPEVVSAYVEGEKIMPIEVTSPKKYTTRYNF